MEEHRYTCPTHVREFTRYRAHVDLAQDRPSEAQRAELGPDPEPAPYEGDALADAESDPMAAR
ncbi:MAG TPA: hypothetical protein VGP78_07675 [Solirubrobacteraceae bacterium]|jgi:hypothetical protein|nr:hypothetical protein [Solirubrobacteraceae bacterium]